MWGRGGLSEHEMDRAGGLRWLTKPVYILNDTLLGRGRKRAQQAKHSGARILRFFNSQVKVCVSQRYDIFSLFFCFNLLHSSCLRSSYLPLMSLKRFIKRIQTEPLKPLAFLLLLSVVSFIPWQKAPEKSAGDCCFDTQ